VHGLLVDVPNGRCAPGWITAWDLDTQIASVAGFREELAQGFTQAIFLGREVQHEVPSRAYMAPETVAIDHDDDDQPTVPLVASFHLPGECPWNR
jgi:hypothetical protein